MVGHKLGTPEAIGESWEGMVYTRVFLSDMRERLGAQGFDGDAYVADWESDLEAILGDGRPRDVATQPLEPLADAKRTCMAPCEVGCGGIDS